MSNLFTYSRTHGIPPGVRVITHATAVRWFGWGFAEALMPIFLFQFAHTYAATGLLRSVFDIAFILALPIVGMAADRFSATTLILISAGLYIFIGTSYFLAGLTGLAIFVVIARVINGPSWALDVLGRETYIRRRTPKNKLAAVFGYFDTVANFWWIVAALIGMFLVQHIAIHTLLFLITPTAMLGWLIIRRFRQREQRHATPIDEGVPQRFRQAYGVMIGEIRGWDWRLRSVALFNFFIAFATTAIEFFLPIESYLDSGTLTQPILIGVLLTIPTLFGWTLGSWFDRKGIKLFVYGLIAFGILFCSLAFSQAIAVKLIVAFGAGIILELLAVGSNELITVFTNPQHFGRVGGAMSTIDTIGGLVGPLVIGILLDWQGIRTSYLTLGIITFCLAGIFFIIRKVQPTARLPKHKTKHYHHRIHQKHTPADSR